MAALVNVGTILPLPSDTEPGILFGLQRDRTAQRSSSPYVAQDAGSLRWVVDDSGLPVGGASNSTAHPCNGPYLSKHGASPSTCSSGISRVWCSAIPKAIAALPAGSSLHLLLDKPPQNSDKLILDGFPFAQHSHWSDPLHLAASSGNHIGVRWGSGSDETDDVAASHGGAPWPAVSTTLRHKQQPQSPSWPVPSVQIIHDYTPERLGWSRVSCEVGAKRSILSSASVVLTASPSTASDLHAFQSNIQVPNDDTRTSDALPVVIVGSNSADRWHYSADPIVAASRVVGASAAALFSNMRKSEQ